MSSSFSSLALLTPEQLSTLSNVPSIPPPKGVTPNFVNPENQNQPHLIITSILFGIMILTVLNRIYVKSFIIRKYSIDDATLAFGVLGCIAYYVSIIWGINRGTYGRHLWDISISQDASLDFQIPVYLTASLWPPIFLFVKISFFIMYLQVFGPKRWLRICAYIGAIFTLIFYLALTVVIFYLQTPRRGETWFSHLPSAESNASKTYLPTSAIGLVIDLYIFVLPIIVVSQLQLPLRRKVGITLIFMYGLIACISSSLSIYFRKILVESIDITWAALPVTTVTLAEMVAGITCACLPSVAQTFRYNLPNYKTLHTICCFPFRSLRSNSKEARDPFFSNSRKKNRYNANSGEFNRGLRMNDYTPIGESPTYPSKAMSNGQRTCITRGAHHDNDKDGIHMLYEIQQDSTTSYAKSQYSGQGENSGV